MREFLFPKHNKAGPEEEKAQAGTAGVSLYVYVKSSLMMVLLHCGCLMIYGCQFGCVGTVEKWILRDKCRTTQS